MQPLSDNLANVPAFLTKLWKMVSDSKTDHLIRWSPDGTRFVILNQMQFWYELLPLYYKHNNMSSFVRQLNMYGFHKTTSVENGPTIDSEKEELQFYHEYFRKGYPELLKSIKRKVSKNSEGGTQVMKNEDLSKVLLDVKQLRGRQATLDSQLAAMKQENAVLWRELAVLRQKHTKQQQIVNKLIQFLVSVVHPGGSRMGVAVKRHFPLMLREIPNKRQRNSQSSQNDGPTIHELDNEFEMENEVEPEELLTSENEEKDLPLIYRPLTPTSSTPSLGVLSPLSNIDLTNELLNDADTVSNTKVITSLNKNKESYWDKSNYLLADNSEEGMLSNELMTGDEIEEDPILDILEDNINDSKQKVFTSPSSQDALLSNFADGDFNLNVANGKREGAAQSSSGKSSDKGEEQNENSILSNMSIATRKNDELEKVDISNELGSIIQDNQSEIDLVKDLLQGCVGMDTNAFMADVNRMPFYQPDYTMFGDVAEYGLSFTHDNELNPNSGDPMVSGQELTTYPPLEQLLDDSLNNADLGNEIIDDEISQLNTPQVTDLRPSFPTDKC